MMGSLKAMNVNTISGFEDFYERHKNLISQVSMFCNA